MKAIDDAPVRRREIRLLGADLPRAGQSPFVDGGL
jgi:hypothetical protein